MGDARYYARVEFRTAKAAEQAYAPVRSFLARMAQADDAYQENRPHGEAEARAAYAKLEQEFPDVWEMLKLKPPTEKTNEHGWPWGSLNFLAGQLDSPTHEYCDFEMDVVGRELRFSGTVWHNAEWEPLMRAMKHFGAIKAGYASDEYVDVDMYGEVGLAAIR